MSEHEPEIQITDRVALGTWPLSGEFTNQNRIMGWGPVLAKDAIETIQFAHESGIRWFDVADVYGFGAGLKYIRTALAGIDRSQYKINLKLGYYSPDKRHPYSPDVLREQFYRSLEMLDTDHVDILSFHNLFFGKKNAHLEEAAAIYSSWEHSGEAVSIGRRYDHHYTGAKFAGVSDEEISHSEVTASTYLDSVFPHSSLHAHINLLTPQQEVDTFSRKAGNRRTVINKPLAQGRLMWGLQTPTRIFPPSDHRNYKGDFSRDALSSLATKVKKALAEANFQEHDLPEIALTFALNVTANSQISVGAKSKKQMTDIVSIIRNMPDIPLKSIQRFRSLYFEQTTKIACEEDGATVSRPKLDGYPHRNSSHKKPNLF